MTVSTVGRSGAWLRGFRPSIRACSRRARRRTREARSARLLSCCGSFRPGSDLLDAGDDLRDELVALADGELGIGESLERRRALRCASRWCGGDLVHVEARSSRWSSPRLASSVMELVVGEGVETGCGCCCGRGLCGCVLRKAAVRRRQRCEDRKRRRRQRSRSERSTEAMCHVSM